MKRETAERKEDRERERFLLNQKGIKIFDRDRVRESGI